MWFLLVGVGLCDALVLISDIAKVEADWLPVRASLTPKGGNKKESGGQPLNHARRVTIDIELTTSNVA